MQDVIDRNARRELLAHNKIVLSDKIRSVMEKNPTLIIDCEELTDIESFMLRVEDYVNGECFATVLTILNENGIYDEHIEEIIYNAIYLSEKI